MELCSSGIPTLAPAINIQWSVFRLCGVETEREIEREVVCLLLYLFSIFIIGLFGYGTVHINKNVSLNVP